MAVEADADADAASQSERTQYIADMVSWMHRHVPDIRPDIRLLYATRWYEDNGSTVRRVARLVAGDASWLEARGLEAVDAADVRDALLREFPAAADGATSGV